jgi:hypothetical protein
LHTALSYHAAGISIIPVRRDGTKAPDAGLLPLAPDLDTGKHRRSWDPFKERLPTHAEVRNWFDRSEPPGIGAVGGRVSGNLEQLDFDGLADEIFPQWRELVEAERPGLVARLNVTRTPRRPAGYHVRYRCSGANIPGNTKLARDPAAPPGEQVLIETRGEGGYAVTPGSPAECHATGGTYEHHSGPPLTELPDLKPEEREALVWAARYFDRTPPEAAPKSGANGSGPRPGDDYDLRGPDWGEILGPAGWECVFTRHEERRWRRPGKEGPGWSAITGRCKGQNGADLFRVFSGNAAPFEEGKAYGKFRAFALLRHRGDYRAAAAELAQQGYGEQANHYNGKAPAGQGCPGEPPSGAAPESGPQPLRGGWEPPLPLSDAPAVPPFPSDVFPGPLERVVTEGAAALPCPPDYIAVPLLVRAGAAIGNSRRLAIKGSHTQGTALYAGVVGPPGSAKTPAQQMVFEDAHAAEEKLHEEWEESMKDYQADLAEYEADRKKKGTVPNALELSRMFFPPQGFA